MYKKMIVAGALCCAAMSAHAGLYIGPMVSYDSLTSGDITYEGVSPRFNLGYSLTLKKRFYLALEVFGSPKTFTIRDESSEGKSLRTTYTYGGSLIPGIVLDYEVTIYGRLGAVKTRFDDLSATRNGYQGGLGIEWDFTPAWSVRGEYDYTRYRSFNDVSAPENNQLSIGLIRRFG